MSEYKKMAIDFLNKVGVEMSIEYVGDVEGFPNDPYHKDKYMHRAYEVCLSRGDKKYITPFYGSYMDWRAGNDPSEYDVLACLEKYDVGNIRDFVLEFGYEIKEWADAKKIENIYESVVEQYEALTDMFSEEEMEMLREIS